MTATSDKHSPNGASGMIAERASQWSLDGPDWDFMERQKYVWNPLMDYWFRMEIEGWENIPDPPVLLIGIHSGAPFVWDAWTVGAQWWRHFGDERALHGTAHDMLMAFPVIGSYFRKMGVLPARRESIEAALKAGHDVALWPGGERDSLRPWLDRDTATLAGRTGFVKLAIRAGVPIVPIATIGGADAMPVLLSGRRLAKLLAGFFELGVARPQLLRGALRCGEAAARRVRGAESRPVSPIGRGLAFAERSPVASSNKRMKWRR